MQALSKHLINASYYEGLTLNPVNKGLLVRHMHKFTTLCFTVDLFYHPSYSYLYLPFHFHCYHFILGLYQLIPRELSKWFSTFIFRHTLTRLVLTFYHKCPDWYNQNNNKLQIREFGTGF